MTIIKATLRGVAEMDRIEAPLDGDITHAIWHPGKVHALGSKRPDRSRDG